MDNQPSVFISPRTGDKYDIRPSNSGGWFRYEILLNGKKVQFALDEKGIAASVEHFENPGPDLGSRFD